MKIRTWPQGGHLLTKLFSLLAVLAIAACSAQTAVIPTQVPLTLQRTSISWGSSNADSCAHRTAHGYSSCLTYPRLLQPSNPLQHSPQPQLHPALSRQFDHGGHRRSVLQGRIAGTHLTARCGGDRAPSLPSPGTFLTADCKTGGQCLLDFWQANAQGQYDEYWLHAARPPIHRRQRALSVSYYRSGVVPGTHRTHPRQSPGRQRPHPDHPVVLPGVADNQSDSIFDPSLLVNVTSSGTAMLATFNFVISLK